MTIDFLIPPSERGDKTARIKHIEDEFTALVAEGLMLSFEDFVEVALSGPTIKGEIIENRKIQVCGLGVYIVLKAFDLNNRGEPKDAYDLFYTIRNYSSGPDDVAARFIALGKNKHCERALTILKENFLKIDAIGVVRAMKFLHGADAEGEDVQKEVTGFVSRFVEICERA